MENIPTPQQIAEQAFTFLAEACHNAKRHFAEHNIYPENIMLAIPGYFRKNLEYLNQFAYGATNQDKYKTINGLTMTPGYENKLVFFYQDWHYYPDAKPFVVDFPDQFKLITYHANNSK